MKHGENVLSEENCLSILVICAEEYQKRSNESELFAKLLLVQLSFF